MAHPIVDGPIKIIKCVTPGCYWVECKNCHGNSRIPYSISDKPFNGDFFPPQGSSVFVHDSEGFFYKGTICGQKENLKYTVQLTDTFQVKDFKLDRIYPSFGENCTDCESAHMISLQNILPALPPDNFGAYTDNPSIEVVVFERKVREWDTLTAIAEEILSKCSQISFKATFKIRGSEYGTIFCNSSKTSQEETLAGRIVFSKIAKRVSHCFDGIVEALMSYKLYRGYHFLPHVFPYGPTVPIPRRIPERQIIPSKKLIVHKDDEDFYLKILNKGWFVLMLFKPPRDSDTILRFVTEDGLIVLASVAYARIHFCIELGSGFQDELRHQQLLNDYLNNPISTDVKTSYFSDPMFLPYGEESDDFSDEPNQGFEQYVFKDALDQFTAEGGKLELFTKTRVDGSYSIPSTMRTMFVNLNIESLRPWQKVMLPFMEKRENVVIIGSKSCLKMTTSLISVFSSMPREACNPQSSARISPILVVFVPNFHRADHVARLCLLLSTPFKVISLTTIRFSATQQQDAIGCDVIVTTPDNWIRLFDGGKECCIDTSRLEFAVYDCSEELNKNAPELNNVFQTVLKTQFFRSIQIIVLLRCFQLDVMSIIQRMASFCVCLVDRLENLFSVGVKPTVVFVSDDWPEHLIRIFETDLRSNRLLLCSDYCQVTAIESKISQFDDVLYIHEDQSNEQIFDTLKLWKANERKILVSSDVVFSQMEFTNKANLLISWNPNSRDKLIERLRSFSERSPCEEFPVSVYIFCDRNDLPSILFVEEGLLGVKGIEFFNGTLHDVKKLCIESQEKSLVAKYCPDFLSLGACFMENCNLKHVMDSKEITEPNDHACFLKIKSVKIRSAYYITGQFEDIFLNQTGSYPPLLGLRSQSDLIQDELSTAFKKAPNSVDLETSLEIGKVVGVKLMHDDQVVLKRAKITSYFVGEKTCTVEFLDFDVPNKKINVCNIFHVPKNIQVIPPDLVHIHVTNLKPVYPQLDWSYETTAFIKLFIKLLRNEFVDRNLSWLVGPVKSIIDRHLLVDSLYPCYTAGQQFVPYESVKKLLFDSELVVERLDDSAITSSHVMQLEKRMSELNSEAGAFGVSAVVSSYHSPGLVYIRLLEDSDRLVEFESRLNVLMDSDVQRLPFLGLDELCAIKREESWNRAVVVNLHESDRVTIRYIDYGDCDDVNRSDLFSLPAELGKVLPPYAIECKLAGIRPMSDEWDESSIEAFGSRVWSSCNVFLTLKVNFCGFDRESQLYLVVLKDPEAPTELSINQWLVKEAKAKWDNQTLHLLPR